jgi:uncharacterized membrane protein YhhN
MTDTLINPLFWAMMAVCLADWFAADFKSRVVRYITKPLALILLIAWFTLLSKWQGPLFWFGLAFVFSLIGDVFLLFPEKMFLPGLVAFLTAHIFFIIGFNTNLEIGLIRSWSLIFLIIVAFVGMLVMRYVLKGISAKPEQRKMKIPVLVYGVIISLMLLSALLNFIRSDWAGQAPIAIVTLFGAAMFYISDALLAVRTFVKQFEHADFLVMLFYHLGQIMIALGVLMHFLSL